MALRVLLVPAADSDYLERRTFTSHVCGDCHLTDVKESFIRFSALPSRHHTPDTDATRRHRRRRPSQQVSRQKLSAISPNVVCLQTGSFAGCGGLWALPGRSLAAGRAGHGACALLHRHGQRHAQTGPAIVGTWRLPVGRDARRGASGVG